ncbi:MAG: hypothetical protein EOM20_00420 [Spartobacteria bacterium]|nr:hypothetical protein [Spartobacteria bacterium]
MTENKQFDFWYAVNNTEVLQLPSTRLETFGTSVVNYHLLTELMDSTNKIRVREGRIEAFRPQIITPQSFLETMLEGFGEQASQYAEWMRTHQADLMILRYGFSIRKREVNDHIVSEALPVVVEQVRESLADKADPLGALLIGVEEPWEVCLLKLMVEVVQQSAPNHAHQLSADPKGVRHEIEHEFREAQRDKSRVAYLSEKLRKHKLFAEYEDRFFALVRSHG